ncbi:unnamed protein product [Closterium sp. NIES-53]
MKSAGNESESRDDRFPGQFFFVSTQAVAGPEWNEGFEEPAAVGKITLHSLDYWVIDNGTTYSMTPRADLLTELEPSPVKHVTLAFGQRAEVKGMGKAMFKGADGKMVGLKNGEQRSFMVVYVDDILIFSPSSDLVKEVMLKLQDKFKCKALSDVSFYLRLHIERDVEKRCMRVHQRKYLEALAANFGQSESHEATPFPSSFKCVKGPEEESVGE